MYLEISLPPCNYRRMKITLVNNNFGRLGGTDTFFFNSVELLRRHHVNVSVFVTNPRVEEIRDGDWYVREPAGAVGQFWEALVPGWTTRQFERYVIAVKPDIVHFHGYPVAYTHFMNVLKRRKIPFVHSIHDVTYALPVEFCVKKGWTFDRHWYQRTWPYLYVERNRLRTLRKNVTRIVTTSDAMGNLLHENGYTRPLTIRNFTNTTSTPIQPDHPHTILFFGRLSRIKGVDLLLRCFPLVKRALPDASLKIIGDGPIREELESLTDELGLTESVTFLGKVSDQVVAESLRRSALIAIPSITFENSPLTGIEALAAGVPIIGNNIGGIPEIVQHGLNGFIVDFTKPDEAAAKCIEILGSVELRTRMARAARNLYESEYSPECHYTELMKLYTLYGHG